MASTTATTTASITQATPGISITWTGWTYDGTAHSASGFAYGVGGTTDVLTSPVTFSYKGTGSTSYGPTDQAPSTAGTYRVTVSFAGNANYQATSATKDVTVTKAGTQVNVTVAPSTIQWMAKVDFRAQVSPTNSSLTDTLTGSVTFSVGSTIYGTAQVTRDAAGHFVAALAGVQIANSPGGGSGTNYTVTAAYTSTNPNLASSSGTYRSLHVDPRPADTNDAWGFYTGDRVAWTTGGNSATVKLAATLVDRNSAAPGDLTQATVTFLLDGQPIASARNLPVGLVNASDPTVGTAAAIAQINLSKGAASESHLITVQIGGAYDNGVGVSDAQLMIVAPVPGGRILGANAALSNVTLVPAGYKNAAGYLGKHSIGSQSAFDIQYSKSLKNPQGKLSILIMSMDNANGQLDGLPHVYRVASTAIATLQVAGNTALFSSKCTVSELVNGAWTSLDGGAKLDVSMTDLNPANPSKYDTLGLTVYRSKGGMWYSSNWNSAYTTEINTVLRDMLTVQ